VWCFHWLVAAWAMPLENILESFLRRFTRLQGTTGSLRVTSFDMQKGVQVSSRCWGITTQEESKMMRFACCL
jgi:hypothetical protein